MLVSGGSEVESVSDAVAGPAGRPDPRLVQSAVTALVLVDVLARSLDGDDVTGPALVGAAAAVVLTVVAWLLPWTRVPAWWGAALVTVGILALGLTQLGPDAGGSVALAALPAYFLGRHFGRAGVAAAVLGVVLLVVVPPVVAVEVDAPHTARLAVTALVVVAGALVAALAVAALRREQQVAVAIVDSLPVGVILLDAEGHYRAISHTESELVAAAFPSGCTDADAETALFAADGVTPLARHDTPSARAARGEEFDDVVVWVGADPATRRALSVSARLVRDDRGEFSGASLACHDITGLLHANTVKDDFVATVSHELRTPLTSVLGYLEIVLDRDDLPPGVRAQLAVSLRNARRLDGLMGDLLDTAAEAGGTVLARDDVAVADLVEDAAAGLRTRAAGRGVRVETDVPADLTAHVDPVRMRQVLDHLLSNAVKFARPDGLVLVRAHAEPGAAAGSELVLEVVDDGPGFGPLDRDLLFTRFYRSEQARRDAVPGVGLGLSIVRDIVTAHGGRVEALSDAGRGATFVVRVPCVVAAGVGVS